jgi:hypothetical protein
MGFTLEAYVYFVFPLLDWAGHGPVLPSRSFASDVARLAGVVFNMIMFHNDIGAFVSVFGWFSAINQSNSLLLNQ